jgi:hypothetical protein
MYGRPHESTGVQERHAFASFLSPATAALGHPPLTARLAAPPLPSSSVSLSSLRYGGGWWISLILMCVLCAVIICANILIYAQGKKFKNALTQKKDELNAISEVSSNSGTHSDAPAMSPARKEADRKQLVKVEAPPAEVEMVETPTPAAPAAEEEEAAVVVGTPADAPVEEEAAPVEEEAPAAEKDAAAEE